MPRSQQRGRGAKRCAPVTAKPAPKRRAAKKVTSATNMSDLDYHEVKLVEFDRDDDGLFFPRTLTFWQEHQQQSSGPNPPGEILQTDDIGKYITKLVRYFAPFDLA